MDLPRLGFDIILDLCTKNFSNIDIFVLQFLFIFHPYLKTLPSEDWHCNMLEKLQSM